MASDMHGCSKLEPPPPSPPDENTKFVVLMARHNCTFFEKVQNAEKAGYKAAIVYNTDSNDLVEMSGDSDSLDDVKIPSMFIGLEDAMEIRQFYLYDPVMLDFMLVLNRNLPFHINTPLLWAFVAVVVICFLSMIIVTVVKWIRHRNRLQRERLPHRELRKLAVIKFQAATCRYDTCSICLEDYVEGERLRVLPCKHTYHTKCIDPWLTRGKRNCPLCKAKIRFGRRANRRQERRSSDSSSDSGSGSVGGGGGGGAGVHDDRAPLLNNNNSRESRDMGTFRGQAANGGEEGQPQQQRGGGDGDTGDSERIAGNWRR